MTNEQQTQLVTELSRAYNREQLSQVVRRLLGSPLEHYAIASDFITEVEQLIEKLKQEGGPLTTFLVHHYTNAKRPSLRAAAGAALGQTNTVNPYRALVILEEPFVDRTLFRDKLQDIFEQNRSVLIARGQRASGRSHSQWLINHVAGAVGATFIFVDLLTTAPDDVISQLINEMSLPPVEFRDRMAQFSTKAAGFVSALKGHLNAATDPVSVCITFDHLDRPEVSPSAREFVDVLMREAAMNRLPGIKIVVLGHASVLPDEVAQRAQDETIEPLQPSDVERFFTELAAETGVPLPPERAAALSRDVFDGLNVPLDARGMNTMAERLKGQIQQFV